MRPLFTILALALGFAMPLMATTDGFAAEKAAKPVKKSAATSADTGNPSVAPLTTNECIKLGGEVLQEATRCPKGTCPILPDGGTIRNVCITELN